MLAQKPPINQPQLPQIFLPGFTHPVSKKMHYWHLFTYYTLLSWEKIVIVLLGLIALRQLYEGSQFIVSDFKILEMHFSNHTTNSAEVREILNEAIALMLDTIINFAMAVRLTTAQERVSRILELILGTALIIWSNQVITFLQGLDYTLINQSVTFLDPTHYL